MEGESKRMRWGGTRSAHQWLIMENNDLPSYKFNIKISKKNTTPSTSADILNEEITTFT